MKIKKSIAIVLCLTLIYLIMPSFNMSYIALAETPIWDGTYDTAWYDSEETELHISTAEELAGMARLVNSGKTMSGQTIYLDNDIYLNDVSNYENWSAVSPANNWIPIGKNKTYYFDGTFEGQGYNIVGLYLNNSSYAYAGFFGYNGKNGVISNFNLKNAYIYSSYAYLGSSSASYTSHHYIGGVCAYNYYGTLSQCNLEGTIDVEVFAGCPDYTKAYYYYYYGGICGKNDEGLISKSYAAGNIIGSIRIGSSWYYDDLVYVYSYSGGICGVSSGDIADCRNSCAIDSITDDDVGGSYSYCGGICGYIGNGIEISEIIRCCNKGDIISYANDLINSGGLIGRAEDEFSISNCYNQGDVDSRKNNSSCGGIVGYCKANTEAQVFEISNVYNIGTVTNGILDSLMGDFLSTNNCYYLIDSSPTGVGSGTDSTISKTHDEMITENFVALLGDAFIYNENGYPLLTCEIENKQLDLLGDADINGVVDVYDAMYCLQVAAYSIEISVSDTNIKNGDVDGDGALTSFDALLILQKLSDNIDKYPIERT